ncbi:hypothetical protein HanRHA438_Chr04g0170551 [Helianthus annuus]|nr:hypothetical protein HanRHA438_Chr04g0170551 [Helianthus annuus]
MCMARSVASQCLKSRLLKVFSFMGKLKIYSISINVLLISFHSNLKKAPLSVDTSFPSGVNWMPQAMKMKEPEIIEHVGLDYVENLHPWVKEAITFLEAGFPTSGSHPKFQHRQSSFKELQYIRDGDNNGVPYYAGTSYGKHQWVNPVLAKVYFSFNYN